MIAGPRNQPEVFEILRQPDLRRLGRDGLIPAAEVSPMLRADPDDCRFRRDRSIAAKSSRPVAKITASKSSSDFQIDSFALDPPDCRVVSSGQQPKSSSAGGSSPPAGAVLNRSCGDEAPVLRLEVEAHVRERVAEVERHRIRAACRRRRRALACWRAPCRAARRPHRPCRIACARTSRRGR